MMNDQIIDDQSRYEHLIQAANRLIDAGEDKRALDLLLYMLEDPDKDAYTYSLTGLAYQSLGQIEEAETKYRKAVEIDPDLPEAMLGLGLFLISHDRKSDGAEWLRKYLELDHWQDIANVEVFVTVMSDLDKREEAVEFLSAVWEEKHNPENGLILARLFKELNRLEDTCALLELIAVMTEKYSTYYKLGFSRMLNRQYQKAISSFEQAIEQIEKIFNESDTEYYNECHIDGIPADERISICWYFIAQCYIYLEDGEKALDAIEQGTDYIGVEEDMYDVLVKMKALILLQKYQEVAEIGQSETRYLEVVEEDSSPFTDVYRMWANALEEMDQRESAITVLKEGTRNIPKNGKLYWDTYKKLEVTGNTEESFKILENAVNAGVSINETIILEMYFILLHRVGRKSDAAKVIAPYMNNKDSRDLEPILRFFLG